MIQSIHSFSEIVRLGDGALYVFDIDETLFTIPWEHWKSVCECSCDPIQLDSENLQALLGSITPFCKIILLTSRHESLRAITEIQLRKIGFPQCEIYFDQNKGQRLLQILDDCEEMENVVFVDDLVTNVLDVHNCLTFSSSPVSILSYHIVHSNPNL